MLSHFLEKKEEWMTLTSLHGFLTALISGPNLIVPSQWHPYAFGKEGLDFESEEETIEILSVLSHFNNSIIKQLENRKFKPILYENEEFFHYQQSDEFFLQEWCGSYLEGTRFGEDWSCEEEAVAGLFPLGVLSNEFDLKGEKDRYEETIIDDFQVREDFKKKLPDIVCDLYEFWKKRRLLDNSNITSNEPYQRTHSEIGRNDPCPCGSGKKYKKCCALTKKNYH